MKRIYLLLISIFSFVLFACDQDDEINRDSNFRLEFSTDTLSFDTLFTSFGSTTKQLKIYNRSNKIAQLTSIGLLADQSRYRLNINGIEANRLKNLEIPSRDSIFIFVEVELNDEDKDQIRLLEDYIQIELNGNVQKLVLNTYAQDVYRIDENIKKTTIWTANRPYVVTKPIWVEQNVRLTLNAGSKIHFSKKAGIHCRGNFEVNGTYEKPVLFESTRLEKVYKEAPGQWDGLYFYPESDEISMNHFILKNGKNGIKIDREKVKTKAVQISYGRISNFTETGLSIGKSNLVAHDLLLTNCGDKCLFLQGEGNYQIAHATIYNYWIYSPRLSSAVVLDNPTTIRLGNTIVYGGRLNELLLSTKGNIKIENSLLKLTNNKQLEYKNNLQACLFNQDPKFSNVKKIDFTLLKSSPAIDKGKFEFATTYPLDFLEHKRDFDKAPDIGTYEFFEKKN
jgi:hypothetical protein